MLTFMVTGPWIAHSHIVIAPLHTSFGISRTTSRVSVCSRSQVSQSNKTRWNIHCDARNTNTHDCEHSLLMTTYMMRDTRQIMLRPGTCMIKLVNASLRQRMRRGRSGRRKMATLRLCCVLFAIRIPHLKPIRFRMRRRIRSAPARDEFHLGELRRHQDSWRRARFVGRVFQGDDGHVGREMIEIVRSSVTERIRNRGHGWGGDGRRSTR